MPAAAGRRWDMAYKAIKTEHAGAKRASSKARRREAKREAQQCD